MTKATLPENASVVVIGGGVMGCSTLYHLAKRGIADAILLERNKLTSGTTWHSAAQVRALRSTRNLTDLIRYSISLYKTLEEETGQNVGWINKGSLSIATNEDRMVHIKRQEALANLFGVEAQSVSKGEAVERWPLMNGEDVLGAVWSPDDGRVSPSDLCAGLIKGAKSRGARIYEDTAVIGILTKGGRVIGVETDQGTIRCDAIALCTGLWSRKAGAMAGVDIPVYPCEHFYLLTKPVDGIEGNLPTLSDHDSHLYIRDDSGGLLVGCFEPIGKAIDPDRLGDDFAFQLLPEDWDHFEPMMMNALHRLPVLETAEVRMLLNGPESFTPDGSFMLGETAETRGLFLGCGMNSVGIATGGGAGMALADCIIDGATPTDLYEADPKRFPDCFNSAEALAARAPEVLGKHYEITYPGRQWDSARGLRKLPLHKEWVKEKAHFGQVFGFERPLYFHKQTEPKLGFEKPDWFDQVGLEVACATNEVAIFDQSSFGKISIKGRDAEVMLNRVCTNNMRRPIGRAIYTTMLNEKGGIESDLTALRLDNESYRLYVGSSAIKRDMAWLQNHIETDEQIVIEDQTDQYATIAVMGPKATAVMEALGAGWLGALGYFHHAREEIAGVMVDAVRLSYVGEPGWELTCAHEDANTLYSVLNEFGARPAGTLAQSSMRIEKQFLAYGHELDTDVSPIMAGLEFTLDMSTPFIGYEAMQRALDLPAKQSIVSLRFTDPTAVPLGNEPVYHDGRIIGKTTSASFGYRIGCPVALAYIDSTIAIEGTVVFINIAGTHFAAHVSRKALFDPMGRRMRIK
ncbi:FAD-dependent oxidoreductase [Alphaproteobacteria bacterium]|nr:FAD-dependent oxidoreductase [Alphaproteobacteria bacterium]